MMICDGLSHVMSKEKCSVFIPLIKYNLMDKEQESVLTMALKKKVVRFILRGPTGSGISLQTWKC